MANSIYVSIKGKTQGLISAGCCSYDSIGNRYQTAHKDRAFVLSLDTEIIRNQHVNHLPVRFKKLIDKSSPLLGVAISNNEELELSFYLYRTSQEGQQEQYFQMELRGATLNRMGMACPHCIDDADAQPEEHLSVSYQSITWKHLMAGTSGYSIWEDRVY